MLEAYNPSEKQILMSTKQSENSAIWNTIAHFNHSVRQYREDYLRVSFFFRVFTARQSYSLADTMVLPSGIDI